MVKDAFERSSRSWFRPWPPVSSARLQTIAPRPVRTHLIILVLGILIPFVALQGFMLWRFAVQERATYASRLLQSANAIAADIDRDIEGLLITLRSLSLSNLLQTGDLRGFHLLSRQATQGEDLWLIVVDKGLQQVSNSLVEFGAQLGSVAGEDVTRRVFATGKPQVSDLLFGRISKRYALDVAYPVAINGEVRYVLLMVMGPQRLLQTLQAQKMPPDWTGGITDRNGRVIARSAKHDQFVGSSLSPDLLAKRDLPSPFLAKNLEGVPVLRAVAKTQQTDWMAAVTVPLTAVDAATRRALQFAVLVNAAILALAVTLAISLGRKLSGSLNTAASFAGNVDIYSGSLPTTDVSEVATVLDALVESRLRLQLALDSGTIGIYSWTGLDGQQQWDDNVRRHFGFPEGKPTMSLFLEHIHPTDRAAVQRAIDAAFETAGDGVFLAEYRFRGISDGIERWIAATGNVFGQGSEKRMVGTVRDVTIRKNLEVRQQLLTHELAHRVKNSFAVLQSIMRSTLRTAPAPKDFAAAFTRRMSSIAAAHDILTANQWSNADLEALIQAQIGGHMGDGHVNITGPKLNIPAGLGVPISLVLHELASNAAKYGATSVPAGRVDLNWSVKPKADGGSLLTIDWRESGGPLVRKPETRGFGSTLIERALAGSRVTMNYEPQGLQCFIELDLDLADTAEPAMALQSMIN